MAHSDVCPENLRFTRDYIKNTFRKPYEYQRIDDAVGQIGNNQRLWVLRKAGVPTVKVILVPPNFNRSSEEFFSRLNDQLVRRYSKANYFPSVRGVKSVGINRCIGTSNDAPPPPIPLALRTPHLKTGTVRIDIPVSANSEASSICFQNESQPKAQCNVCPDNLRFTQDSIKNRFKKPYEYQSIDETVDQIGNNQLSPAVLMPLRVVQHKSVLWSLDNRRLWVLRKAGVPTVKVIWVQKNVNRRSEDFFSSLSDPLLERQYSSADYFPHVRGSSRFVGISRSGALPPPTPSLLNHSTTVTNRTPPRPPPPPLRDITVRSNIPPLVSPLPNAYHQTRKNFVPKLCNKNSGPGGKKGSDSLWGKILNVVSSVMEKGFGFFRFITSRAFDPCNEKFVRLGMNALIVLALCYVLCPANNLEKGDVNSKLENRETITVSEGGENGGGSSENVVSEGGENVLIRVENGGGSCENVMRGGGENIFRAENGGGPCENVVSDQNNNNSGASGYLGIVAVKAVVGVEKMVSHLLSKMSCFLRSVMWNAVDLSKGVVVGSGRKTLGRCGVILSQCFNRLHFITGHVAVRLGGMGILVSEFCLEKFWELLRFIKYQAFALPGQMGGWSVGKVQDALSFYLNEIKELLRKVVWSPGKV
ncbi:hypothetical protein SUGI_0101780 [Cryptomeria japonica]|nr:hypothetical protein SUGI_0101780 [Cryptomeria japonica]